MLAAQNDHAQCVDLLIKAGSDVTIRSKVPTTDLPLVRGSEGVGGWARVGEGALLGGKL